MFQEAGMRMAQGKRACFFNGVSFLQNVFQEAPSHDLTTSIDKRVYRWPFIAGTTAGPGNTGTLILRKKEPWTLGEKWAALATPIFVPGTVLGLEDAAMKSQSPRPLFRSGGSVAQSCPTLSDPMDCSTPGLPVHHQLREFTQTHVHRVGDAIQPSHPLSSPSLPIFNLSQDQGLFKWVGSSYQVPKVLEFQL